MILGQKFDLVAREMWRPSNFSNTSCLDHSFAAKLLGKSQLNGILVLGMYSTLTNMHSLEWEAADGNSPFLIFDFLTAILG